MSNDLNKVAALEELTIIPSAQLNCIRAFAGHTMTGSAEVAFDTEEYNDADFLAQVQVQSGNIELVMNW